MFQLSVIVSVMVISGILEVGAKPVAGDDFEKIIEHIRSISATIGASKVDLREHLVNKFSPQERVMIGRRILMRLIQLRDKLDKVHKFRMTTPQRTRGRRSRKAVISM
eukprot:GFUD01063613.1.p1 GENE.GFUD01063613.1~~GFUD01063613.1.p1  ORF type:complete len:108 (-),score=13.21 GFUD01063613.1:279-602(-)